ncbi:hypothetical protein LDENG_00231510, partial [Lucifuga dentata]
AVLCLSIRIQTLSDALGDLYKQFSNLKDELGRLTSKFDQVEAFVDDLKDGVSFPQRPTLEIPPRVNLRLPVRAQMRAPERRIVPGPAVIRASGRRVPRRP